MKIDKIILINPPFYYFPGIAQQLTNYLRVPLGLCYLASYVRQNNKVEVEIIDAAASGLSLHQLEEKIIDSEADLIGFSVVTSTVETVKEIIMRIKKNNKDVPVCVGGPHITAIPDELSGIADVSVIGEGEETFSQLISYLQMNRPIADLSGIAFKENGTKRINPRRQLLADLDVLPFPALDLVDFYKYKHIYPYGKDEKVASILTARGCPYDCYFCGNNYLWKGTVRYHSITYVIKMIEYLKNCLGVSLIWIDDDLFGPEPRVRDFCEQIIAKDLKIRWICHLRCNGTSEDTLRLMKQAGCLEMQIGVESGNDKVLQAMNKKLTVAEIKSFFAMAKKVGINTWATFIFGLYGENRQTIYESIRLAKEIDPTYVTFLHLLPFPGTKIFSDYSQQRYIKTYEWSQYNWHNQPIFETESLSKQDLIELKKYAYRVFYLRSKKICSYLYQLFKTGSAIKMFRNFLLFIKLSLNK